MKAPVYYVYHKVAAPAVHAVVIPEVYTTLTFRWLKHGCGDEDTCSSGYSALKRDKASAAGLVFHSRVRQK